METLANDLNKAIANILDATHDRCDQQHKQQLDDVKFKLETIEAMCSKLSEENKNLNAQLLEMRQKQETSSTYTKKECQELFAKAENFAKWHELIQYIANDYTALRGNVNSMDEKLKETQEAQILLSKQNAKLQKQVAYLEANANNSNSGSPQHTPPLSYRTPMKSTSTYSYLGSHNNYHNLNHQHHNQHCGSCTCLSENGGGGSSHGGCGGMKTNSRMGHKLNSHKSVLFDPIATHESYDFDDDISQLSDQAESLKRGIDALNDCQRSFEKSSLYSDG